jgi:hypothetical protein
MNEPIGCTTCGGNDHNADECKRFADIREVIDRVLWTSQATEQNKRILAEAIADSISAQPAPVVPDGYAIVPVEPTPEMLDVAVSHALMVSLSGDYNWSAYMRDVWLRMISAAAPAPAQMAPDVCDTCGGHGVVTRRSGQTPETYEEWNEDCPDCAAPAQGQQVETKAKCFCGGPFSKNPHADAGKPSRILEVGAVYECIPCLTKSRHEWSKRATAAESELSALKAQQAEQKPVVCMGCVEQASRIRELEHKMDYYTAPQPAPAQDVAGLVAVLRSVKEYTERYGVRLVEVEQALAAHDKQSGEVKP